MEDPKTEACSYFLEPFKCLVEPFILNHPYLGWVVLAVIIVTWILSSLATAFPQFETLKSKVYTPLALYFKSRQLEKKAIASDITGQTNTFLKELIPELPKGWIRPVSIKWVANESKKKFLEEDRTILIMKPVKNQQSNLAKAVFEYFNKNLFPDTKWMIPETLIESAALHLTRRSIGKNSKLEKVFESEIMIPAVKKKKRLQRTLGKYDTIDAKGFLTGTYLREIHRMAEGVKFTELADDIPKEASEILAHIEKFSKNLNSKKEDLREESWYRDGMQMGYKFLLVAMPVKEGRGLIQPYVDRAMACAEEGNKVIYVYGCTSQKKFFRQVVKTIERTVPDLELVEKYRVKFDYRGEPSGLCAVFTPKKGSS